MFSHVVVGANDLEKARKFYDAVLEPLGCAGARPMSDERFVYATNAGLFIVTRPIDGEAATHANGGTIGFNCTSPDQVKAWHDAGVANGGKSIEDPPGIRPSPIGDLYLAYLRDPDGNKLCALHRMPA